MKRLFSILTILMFLFSSLAIAGPPVPAPIIGKFTINGAGTLGYIVEAQNLRTLEVISGREINSMTTEPNGFFFDLSYFSQGYVGPSPVYPGDVIEVRVVGFPTSAIQFNVPSETPYTISLSVTTGSVVQCADGSIVSDISLCPEIEEPEPEPEEKVVEVETKVSSTEDKDTASVEADYGQEIDVQITNTKLETLKDGTLDFNGEDYDFREILYLNDAKIETSIVEEDYGLEPRLVLLERAVEYMFKFDDLPKLSEIEEDEPLEINFSGIVIKIIEAWNDEITIRTGQEDTISEGKDIEIDGKTVTIKSVAQSSVDIDVDGINQIISEGNSREVNGIHIIVESIHYKGYDSKIKSAVTIIAGTQADKTVRDGEDFELFVEGDETFGWIIDMPNHLGYFSKEEYKSVDEDEDYKPLGLGDSFSLPNGYVNIKFSSITDTPRTEITFKVKDGQLLAKGDDGDFVSPTDEYDRVYIDSTGIYDDDDVLIATDKIRLGDSDTYLELGSVRIGKLVIKLDMSDILYDGISYLAEEGRFLDYLGIIFSYPEDGVEEQSGFEVSIPEERPEATISFSAGTEVIEEDVITIPDDTEEEDVEDTTTPTTPDTTTTTVPPVTTTIPPVTPPVITPPDVPPVEPESNLKTILITLIATIIGLFAWGKGFAGLIKYYLKLADETEDRELAKKYRDRAEKMAKTVVTNFLAGKYKK